MHRVVSVIIARRHREAGRRSVNGGPAAGNNDGQRRGSCPWARRPCRGFIPWWTSRGFIPWWSALLWSPPFWWIAMGYRGLHRCPGFLVLPAALLLLSAACGSAVLSARVHRTGCAAGRGAGQLVVLLCGERQLLPVRQAMPGGLAAGGAAAFARLAGPAPLPTAGWASYPDPFAPSARSESYPAPVFLRRYR